MKINMFSNLKGDIFGGLSASIIALPLALAFGIVAFAPLGPAFASQGALACLYGVIFTCFFSSLFGGTPTRITGPTGPMSVMIATIIIAHLQARNIQTIVAGDELNTILALVFLTVLFGGLVQIILGFSGGGKLIKYIPYPVMAGFMNGVAMIIFFSQVKPFLGLSSSQQVIDIFTGAASPSWITIVVASATILAVIFGPKLIKGAPGSLLGLIAGLACFFLIGWMGRPELLVSQGNPLVIGHIPTAIPKPHMAGNFFAMLGGLDKSAWLAIFIPAITLGMLGAIDTLLTCLVADVVTKTRHNSSQELIGQGIGNMIASFFGGLPGAGCTVRTLANIQNGGKTRLSGMVSGLAVFLILMLFGQYASIIPYSVLAGILMVAACRMAETSSFRLIRQKSTWRDMTIILLVAAVTLLWDLMVAVGIGVFITMMLFIRDQITHSVIKNKFLGDLVHSKKVRSFDEMAHLEAQGARIVVYQLEGSIFFGTADGLMKEIEKESNERQFIILDFKRVSEIDLTGAQILGQLNDQLVQQKKSLVLSYIEPINDYEHHRLSAFLNDVKILEKIGEDRLFHDTDRALEWAENRLLENDGLITSLAERRVEIKKMKIFQYLSDNEIDKISSLLTQQSYKADDIIFHEGDEGDTMYLVSRGCVSILFELKQGKRRKRVASFGEGVFFGDMALLEEKPRSASAIADQDTELFALTRKDYLQLLEAEPQIASKIQLGIAKELSARLRSTSEELRALEM